MITRNIITTAVTLAAIVCLAGAAPASATTIGIQEVLYDPEGPDATSTFTELFGPPGLSLDGWSLVGVNGSSGAPYRVLDLTGSVFPPDGIFVVATASANPALAAVRDLIGNVDWQNGPDAVQLWDALGGIVDALQYGDAGEGNAGEGQPAPDVSGLSLSRDAWSTDRDDNAADFMETEPTPGRIEAEAASIPAPATLWLLVLGIGALRQLRTSSPNPRGRSRDLC